MAKHRILSNYGSHQSILEVRNLKTYFTTPNGVVKAVDGVDFEVREGEIFGLVGESGCGKTVTALSILGLIDTPGDIINGEVTFAGNLLSELSEKEMGDYRGNRISMIFQHPQSSLNPVFNVGNQVAEVLQIHEAISKDEAWARTVDLFKQMGLPDAERIAHAYPHELSGGQAQRVMIAMALVTTPDLLIADEPTTALDVTVQAQILNLLRDLRSRTETSIVLITHDLGVIAEMADRVAVMYAGQIVELAEVKTLFDKPMHPYTQGLMDSIPVLGNVKENLEVIPGTVPNMIDLPTGCRFAPRCRARIEKQLTICTDSEPDLLSIERMHPVRCWLYQSAENHPSSSPQLPGEPIDPVSL